MRGEAGGQDHMAEAWAGHVRLGGSRRTLPASWKGRAGCAFESRVQRRQVRALRWPAGRPASPGQRHT